MTRVLIVGLSMVIFLTFAGVVYAQQSQGQPAPKIYALIELQHANPEMIAALFGGTVVPALRLSQYASGGLGGYGGTNGVGGYGASQGYGGAQGGYRGTRSGGRQTGYGGRYGQSSGW